MRELSEGSDTDEDDELQPKVKYSVILQKEEYEDDDDEEDPLPFVDLGPGYYFFDSTPEGRSPSFSGLQTSFVAKGFPSYRIFLSV